MLKGKTKVNHVPKRVQNYSPRGKNKCSLTSVFVEQENGGGGSQDQFDVVAKKRKPFL
jgi:hypothetical protein